MAFSVTNPVLIFLVLAVILDVIAVAMPYWFKSGIMNSGLWSVCFKSSCKTFDTVPTYISTSRVLHMIALIAGIISLITFIFLELTEMISLKLRRIVCTVPSMVAGAFILIADCYMSKRAALYPACSAPSLIASFFFIYVGGYSSTNYSE